MFKGIAVLSDGDFCHRYPFVRQMFTFKDVQELARIRAEKQAEKEKAAQ